MEQVLVKFFSSHNTLQVHVQVEIFPLIKQGYSFPGMLISCFFILLTVAVYAFLPELRNLHGMVLMAYLLSFFVGFLFFATMQILILKKEILQRECTILSKYIILKNMLKTASCNIKHSMDQCLFLREKKSSVCSERKTFDTQFFFFYYYGKTSY